MGLSKYDSGRDAIGHRGVPVKFKPKTAPAVSPRIVDCRDCPALSGEPCVSEDGTKRASVHHARKRMSIRAYNQMSPEEREAWVRGGKDQDTRPAIFGHGSGGLGECPHCNYPVVLSKYDGIRSRSYPAPEGHGYVPLHAIDGYKVDIDKGRYQCPGTYALVRAKKVRVTKKESS